jgi:hypothetical protein
MSRTSSAARGSSLKNGLVLLAVFLVGLFGQGLAKGLWAIVLEAETREVGRVPAPDASEDAVILIENDPIGAWGPSWQVRIVRHGTAANKGIKVFSARGMVNSKLVWNGPRLLEVGYDRARIDYFTNAWTPDPHRLATAVEIRLAPSAPEFSYLRIGSNGSADPPE